MMVKISNGRSWGNIRALLSFYGFDSRAVQVLGKLETFSDFKFNSKTWGQIIIAFDIELVHNIPFWKPDILHDRNTDE